MMCIHIVCRVATPIFLLEGSSYETVKFTSIGLFNIMVCPPFVRIIISTGIEIKRQSLSFFKIFTVVSVQTKTSF